VLSPVVRKLIAEHDLDPDQIEGTGQGGRITRADVLSVIDTGKGKPAEMPKEKAPAAPEERPAPRREEAPAPAARSQRSDGAQVNKAGADDEAIAFSNIRRRTAEHMVRSKATSAHVLVAIEVDFEKVDRVRRAAQGEWKEREGFTLTYLPFISRAVIDAIEDYPQVNASVGDDELIVHRRVHLGIAVDLSFQGLLAPVIHDADGKRLRAIAREVHDLAARARAKKLGADEIQGGTFTITNPGGYGTLITAAIINQPQVAILSTDGVKKKPVAVEVDDGTDAVVVHPVGILALSFDHRAFDGAYASAFIARVKEILETRDWSQEL
jgi:pyruvate dehydrogenase E2 component (dihydrolipoamide acetyltransferase)